MRLPEIFLAAASSLAVFVLGEIVLRLGGFSYPMFYAYDPQTGSKLRSGAAGWWRQEGEAYIKINSEGLRDREHEKIKPPNVVRIAVLGDSYAEALAVPLEKSFWSVMESRLQEKGVFGAKRAEAVNFGVSGYGTAQELMTLRHRVWSYSPDIVILAFTSGNDFRNNSPSLETDRLKPFFKLRDGRLELDDSFREDPSYKLKTGKLWGLYWALSARLRLFQFASLCKARWSQWGAARKLGEQGGGKREAGLDAVIYSGPKLPEWEEAWRVTEALIARFGKEVKAGGARFLLVSVSNGIQVHPDRSLRQEFMRRHGVKDLFYPETRLQSLARKEGFDFLPLAPRMLPYAEKKKAYLHGFANSALGEGHWNEEGHRLAGELIADSLAGPAQR